MKARADRAAVGFGSASVVLALISAAAFGRWHSELQRWPQSVWEVFGACFGAPHDSLVPNTLRMGRELLAFTAFLLTLWAFGTPLQRRFAASLEPIEQVLARFGLGAVALHFLLFALACAQLWYVPLFRAIAVLASLYALGGLVRHRSHARAECVRLARFVGARPWLLLAFGFIALSAVENLGPEVGADAGLYHVGVPTRWLSEHGFLFLREHFLSNLPLPQSMFYGFLIGLGPSDTTRLLPPFMMLLAAAALLHTASRYADTSTAPIEVWGVLAVPSLSAYLAISGSDHLGIAFFALGLLFGLGGRLALAFLFLGLAASTKYTMLVQVGLACLYLAWRARRPLRELVLPVVLLAAPSLVWALKTGLLTGNPVFPFFGHEPLAPRIVRNIQISGSLVHSFADLLKFPLRISFTRSLMYLAGPHWLAIAPLALAATLLQRDDRRAGAVVGAFLAAGWLSFLLLYENARYSGPLFAATALAASIALARSEPARVFARPPVLVLLLLSTLATWSYRVGLVRPYTFVCGRYDAVAYSTEQDVGMTVAAPHALFAFLNRTLDPDQDRVLLIGETRTAGIQVPFVSGSELDFPIFARYVEGALDGDEVRRRLAADGITHIAINVAMASYFEAHAYPVLAVSADGAQLWTAFFERSVRVIAEQHDVLNQWLVVALLPPGVQNTEPVHDVLGDARAD